MGLNFKCLILLDRFKPLTHGVQDWIYTLVFRSFLAYFDVGNLVKCSLSVTHPDPDSQFNLVYASTFP
jgi:hypothetical protein